MKEEVQKIVVESVDILRRRNDFESTSREIEITIPKRREFGDFSTNIAIILASELNKNPHEVAELIIDNISLEGRDLFKKIEIAGPGFINFFINERAIISRLMVIERLGENYGKSNLGKGEKVLVEFVSANPTGYLHMGHARNAAVGDAISNILDGVGFNVTREFYINDIGRQMELLGVSIYRRYQELFGIKKEFPGDGYWGEYIKDIANEIRGKRGRELIVEGALEQESIDYCKEYAKDRLLQEIKKDLNDFGVNFDNWYSEQNELHRALPEFRGGNRIGSIKNELMFKEALEERDGALWFKATEFGDSQDWVLVRRDGASTYFFSDIAYHYDKIQRGFKRLIDVWGADHHGHFSRLLAALRALRLDDFSLKVVLIQFVRLIKDGQEISMSKRAGSYLTMREVMEEVGRDVMRFFLLMRSSESHLDFDLDLAKKESSENPVYYIQYAYARIGSVLEKAKERELSPSKESLNLLSQPEEIDIIKKLLTFPELVRESALSLAPHKLVFYLQEIAADFHVYYNKIRIISEDQELSLARLYFVNCIRTVIRNGLRLLGITTPERM
ncbi:MAG TPA: arginine--tRNA ligase [Thermodesulfobacteriota bacterium]|nr:arginine--tRNA ligase [Thermodesulfobacteriota bacterium]